MFFFTDTKQLYLTLKQELEMSAKSILNPTRFSVDNTQIQEWRTK